MGQIAASGVPRRGQQTRCPCEHRPRGDYRRSRSAKACGRAGLDIAPTSEDLTQEMEATHQLEPTERDGCGDGSGFYYSFETAACLPELVDVDELAQDPC